MPDVVALLLVVLALRSAPPPLVAAVERASAAYAVPCLDLWRIGHRESGLRTSHGTHTFGLPRGPGGLAEALPAARALARLRDVCGRWRCAVGLFRFGRTGVDPTGYVRFVTTGEAPRIARR